MRAAWRASSCISRIKACAAAVPWYSAVLVLGCFYDINRARTCPAYMHKCSRLFLTPHCGSKQFSTCIKFTFVFCSLLCSLIVLPMLQSEQRVCMLASVGWFCLETCVFGSHFVVVFTEKCSLPFGCGVRSTSTTSSCPLPSTAPGPRGTPTSTTARGKRSIRCSRPRSRAPSLDGTVRPQLGGYDSL